MGTLTDVDNALAELDAHVSAGIAKVQAFVQQITGPQDFAATVKHIQAIETAFDAFVASLSPPAPPAG